LPKKYFEHWNKFVVAMKLLSSHSIEKESLPSIRELLVEFVEETQRLYGEEVIRINVHQLLHLIDRDVNNWGLLWTHNAFPYESMNGLFTKFIHGTQLVPKSAVHAFSCMQQLSLKERNMEFLNQEPKDVYNKLQKNNSRYMKLKF
jgi:hypothetical protein